MRLIVNGDIDESILYLLHQQPRAPAPGGRAMCEFQASHRRHGFTLIELLIVISIIGALIALLLPAVQAARAAAHRVACASNLMNLGLALLQYHDVHDTFPPGAVGPAGGFPQFAGLKQHGLAPHLLPYLEQQALFDRYRWDVSWNDPPNQTVVNTRL